MYRVYIAGPSVFRPDAIQEGKRLQKICLEKGLEGLYPLDNVMPDTLGIPRKSSEVTDWIKISNVNLIKQCHAVIADVSPFRGPNMDPGTAWECGYAEAIGKLVFYWTNDPRVLRDRIEGVEYSSVDNSPWFYRDGNGLIIEDLGNVENLMITGIPASGPFHSFEGAVKVVSDIFNRQITAL